MTYDATALLAIYVFLAIPAFLAAIGITHWLVEFVMFAAHLWRTR